MWIIIAIVAYILNAISTIINKILLTTSIPSAFSYTFYVSLLQIISIVFIPFGFFIPSLYFIVLCLVAGATFTFALLCMFLALTKADATTITTVIGGLQPIAILLFTLLFFSAFLTIHQLFAFTFLVLGTIIISYKKSEKGKHVSVNGLMAAIIAALLFAITFTLSDYIFAQLGFVNGFIWTRFGSIFAALFLLIFAQARKEIFQVQKVSSSQKGVFIGNQIIGAIAFILLNYAISLGNVAIISSLQGIQYMSIFLLTIFLGGFFPTLLSEKMNTKLIIQKSIAIVCITIGIIMLSFDALFTSV